MSTDLSEKRFTESAQQGAFSWLFEGFRTRMRDTAKFVRMEAAWRTWPLVHNISKSLQEGLTTSADNEALRQADLHAMAERVSRFYPSEMDLPNIFDPAEREHLALTIGGGLSEGNSNIYGITLDDVLALYTAEYAAAPSLSRPHDMS